MKKESTTAITAFFERAITTLSYSLAFTLPLVSFKGVNEIFEFPKITFFYIFSGTIIFLHLLESFLNGKSPIRKSSFLTNILLLQLVYALSFLFSEAKYTSFFGYYTRFNGGLLSLAVLTLLFISLAARSFGKAKLIESAILGSVPVCLYGIAQHFGYEKGFWVEDSQARVFSSLGQPNWLAAYLVMLFFPTFAKAIKSTGLQKFLYSFISVLIFSTLLFTYSLSGLLGFFIAGVVFVIAQRTLVLRNLKHSALLLLLFSLIAATNPGVLKPKIKDSINDVKKNLRLSFTNRALASQEEPRASVRPEFGDTTAIRLIVWQGTLKLATSSLRNFMIGTGPETFPYAFLKFRPRELNYTTEWDFIFNKPHNYYLELLSNLGVLGLIAYLLLVKKMLLEKEHPQLLGLKEGTAGLLITDLFGWHTIAASLLFYMFALVLVGKATPLQKMPNKVLRTLGIGLTIASYSVLIITSTKHFLADYYNTQAKKQLSEMKIDSAFKSSQKANNLNSWEPTYKRTLATIYLTTTVSESVNGEEKKYLKTLTLNHLDQAYKLQPYNLVNIKNLVPLFGYTGMVDISDEAQGVDAAFSPRILAFYKNVEALAPTDASLALALARGTRPYNKEQAILYYQKALNLKENSKEALTALENLQKE
ncbi:MAG: O-antigen ligase family protein [Patescibacteria group bacterium]